jgi:flagellar motor switch protein FliM
MTAQSLIRRKVMQGGVAPSPLPDPDLLGQALARRVEDRLRAVVKAAMRASVEACRVVKLGDALDGSASSAMVGLVAVADADVPGLVALDGALSFHLVDVTLGGDAKAAPAPLARSFTAIDMALGRMHLDAVVAGFADAIEAAFGRTLRTPLALREQRQSLAQVRLAPDYIDVLHLRLALEIGDGGRRGRFDLVLPLSALDVIRLGLRAVDAAADRARPDDLWRGAMRRAAGAAPVALDAVLHRQKLTVGAISALRPGQVIEIPRSAPQQVELVMAQPEGRSAVVALARLGAFDEMKVLKLTTPLEPGVGAHVGAALRLPSPPGLPSAPPSLTYSGEAAAPEA